MLLRLLMPAMWAVTFLAVGLLAIPTQAEEKALTEKFTVEELVTKLRAKLDGDEIVGIWVDERHMCGLAAISSRKGKLHHTLLCYDGSASDLFYPLALTKPPANAKRAWKTPGLTRKSLTTYGSRTVEYLDKNGDRHDLHTFVEGRDDLLYGYQDGVGLDDTKNVPWMAGKRVK